MLLTAIYTFPGNDLHSLDLKKTEERKIMVFVCLCYFFIFIFFLLGLCYTVSLIVSHFWKPQTIQPPSKSAVSLGEKCVLKITLRRVSVNMLLGKTHSYEATEKHVRVCTSLWVQGYWNIGSLQQRKPSLVQRVSMPLCLTTFIRLAVTLSLLLLAHLLTSAVCVCVCQHGLSHHFPSLWLYISVIPLLSSSCCLLCSLTHSLLSRPSAGCR